MINIIGSCVVGIVIGSALGVMVMNTRNKVEKKVMEEIKKNNSILRQWLIYKQSGVGIDTILKENNIKTVAIYGMGEMGRNIIRDLYDSDIIIKYGIDRNKIGEFCKVNVKKLCECKEKPDLVINSIIRTPDKSVIEKKVKEKLGCRVVSLDELIFNYVFPKNQNI